MSAPRVSAQQAWDTLAADNARFMEGALEHPQQDAARRSALSSGQHPDAAFLGCADSRVAAEILFDCGLGDLFVARNIGQIANANTIATMEYAVSALGVALIVVLAHDSCGAVKAAIEQSTANPPELTPAICGELERIRPAVQREWFGQERTTPYVDPAMLDADAVGRRHLEETVSTLLRDSRVIADAVAAGTLAVAGCQYQLDEGRVMPLVQVGQVETG